MFFTSIRSTFRPLMGENLFNPWAGTRTNIMISTVRSNFGSEVELSSNPSIRTGRCSGNWKRTDDFRVSWWNIRGELSIFYLAFSHLYGRSDEKPISSSVQWDVWCQETIYKQDSSCVSSVSLLILQDPPQGKNISSI